MHDALHFSQDYREARERFIEAVRGSGRAVASYENTQAAGPEGERLTTEVAFFGPPEAQNLLILISGTHGVEGFCGSACQTRLIAEGRLEALPADSAVLLIHAINPYGFAWLRRVNEDNVDLNRNSVDHTRPPAPSGAYDRVHLHLLPKEWTGEGRAQADRCLEQFVRDHGLWALQAAVTGGQYTHADGLFYGGRELVWSTRTFQSVLGRFGRLRRRVALIDFHTGLGPAGHGEPIYTESDTPGLVRAREWYGADVTSHTEGDSISAAVHGALINGARWALPDAELTPITLEFGTYPAETVLEAMRAEQWLHQYGDLRSELGLHIKTQMRDAFYVDTDAWKSAVLERGGEIVEDALLGLSNPVR